jgi:hypothetical protein
MSAGVTFVNWVFTFNSKGLGVQLEFVSPDPAVNAARFEALLARRAEMEAEFGAPLTWEPMDGYKGTRVSTYDEVADVAQVDRWDEWIDWLIATCEQMRAALDAAGGVPLP